MNTFENGTRPISLWRKLWSLDLNTPHALAVARIAIPLLFGLWSLWLGQDRNWDAFNYHLHNAYSFLHGKLHTDFAPAGLQTYFNPVLDAAYYLLYAYLPAPVVGFLLGVFHGLDFVLLLSIIRLMLPGLPEEDRHRLPLLLAVAGVLTANFLSGLGNSMGDDTTSLFTLASLLLLLNSWERLGGWSFRAVAIVVAAGILVGLGMGLKLTNAVYAVSLCVALLLFPASPAVRVRLAFLFGVGALLGLALTGGYWLWVMWRTFQNPFFPQFSSLFPNALAPSGGIADTSWLPRNTLETVLWPFVFSLNSKRVGQATLHQVIWPVVYILFWAWVVISAIRFFRRSTADAALDPKLRYAIAFVALGYLLWMKLFSIYRYIVPIELLTPFLAFVLLTQLFPYLTARRVAAWTLSATTLIVVAGGVETWGHERWASHAFRAEVPQLETPQNTTAIIVGADPAWGWLTIFFPPSVSFTQIGGSFPFTPQYSERIKDLVYERGGPSFAVVTAKDNWRVDNVAKMNGIARGFGLTSTQRGCDALQWTVSHLRLHASVQWQSREAHGSLCQLNLRADDVRDVTAENVQLVEQARPLLESYGFTIDPRTCSAHRAYAGQGAFPYQWCRLTLH
ncbi:hypothetical protein EOS_02455 [Caballeronia mineralivorans PML1(12)]|uniref:DUF2029 domain-containing protein n=2 Tax=Caballeronia mineralivorans TaxID=2010198 RepID=A0A0J1D509_9BURK|nr:hypothetical protein EOS_02455 [Caballeronia mineralivorans PML1(12)]